MNALKRLTLIAFGLFLLSAFGGAARAADETGPYADLALKMRAKGLVGQGAFDVLSKITGVGPRLTGSPGAAAGVALTLDLMKELGLEARLEPVEVGHWVRGEGEARLVSSVAGTLPLAACALGGSIGTPDIGLSAGVFEVHSFEELRAAGDKAKGKIVFFNRAWDQSLPETFSGYGPMAQQRDQGAIEAAKAGGVAALVRSASTSLDDYPHTGIMHYDPAVAKVPAAALSTLAANKLSDTLKLDPGARVFLRLSCRTEAPVISSNVLGDLRGSEKPGEIILLGGHLDSWDLATGAHDDGAGCAQAVEALRLIKDLGLKPKRTIRAVMFMDEETGGTGGRAYASSPERLKEKHLVAIESDRGGFLPLGMGIGNMAVFARFKKWEPVFQALGLWLRPGGGGVDVGPLAKTGTVMGGLVPDSQRYFDVHHSGKDVLAAVNPRELELGAVAMAVMAYILAQEGV